MEKQIVIFELGAEHFGIDIAMVEGIVKVMEITKIPKAPAFVEGVALSRGQIIPVVDLHKRFGMAPSEKTDESRIVVASVGNAKIGMIVSSVSEVLTVDDACIEPPLAMLNNMDSSYIVGIAKLDKHLVILLDLSKILTVEEIKHVSQIALM